MDLTIGTAQTAERELSFELDQTLRVERTAFAAKLRAARAVLGLSQEQFAQHIGLTQKSVHRIEQGVVQPQLRTILKIEQFWRRQGIVFENLRNGGFRLVVEGAERLVHQEERRLRHERAAESDPLLHAARQVMRHLAAGIGQVDEVQ